MLDLLPTKKTTSTTYSILILSFLSIIITSIFILQSNSLAAEVNSTQNTSKTSPPKPEKQGYQTKFDIITSPNDSLGFDIQIIWPKINKSFWTDINGETWQKLLHGEWKTKIKIKKCNIYNKECSFVDGYISLTTPPETSPKNKVDGKLIIFDGKSTKEIPISFSTLLEIKPLDFSKETE
jgi:hypothetical protein